MHSPNRLHPTSTRLSFMQQELTETFQQASQTNTSRSSRSPSQHGSCHSQQPGIDGLDGLDGMSDLRSRSASPYSVWDDERSNSANVDQLDEQLRRLSRGSHSSDGRARPAIAGQRISDYEKASNRSSSPRQAQGFTVVRRQESPSGGVQLTDFPNG